MNAHLNCIKNVEVSRSVQGRITLKGCATRKEPDAFPYPSLLDSLDFTEHKEFSEELRMKKKEAQDNALIQHFRTRRDTLFRNHIDIFRTSLSSEPTLILPLLNNELNTDVGPVPVHSRNYSQEQSHFWNNSLGKEIDDGMAFSYLTYHWASAPSLMQKPAHAKFFKRFLFDPRTKSESRIHIRCRWLNKTWLSWIVQTLFRLLIYLTDIGRCHYMSLRKRYSHFYRLNWFLRQRVCLLGRLMRLRIYTCQYHHFVRRNYPNCFFFTGRCSCMFEYTSGAIRMDSKFLFESVMRIVCDASREIRIFCKVDSRCCVQIMFSGGSPSYLGLIDGLMNM